MKSHKVKKDKKHKSKIDDPKMNSTSSKEESSDSEHELIYYESDRVKLMQKVLRKIKPKKIKAMAPDCIKDLDIDEINSMLLEELLGISKKRLKVIFAGKNLASESSSSDSEEDKVDVISLDDITTDDDLILLESQEPVDNHKESKNKKTHLKTKVKEEVTVKQEKSTTKSPIVEEDDDEEDQDRVMSVLELLELQARARAIRSQLALEKAEKKKKKLEKMKQVNVKEEDKDDSDSVIIESPKHEAILIASDSDVEREDNIETSVDNLPMNIEKLNENSNNVQILEATTEIEADSENSKAAETSSDVNQEIALEVSGEIGEQKKINTDVINESFARNSNDTTEMEGDEEIIINITDQDVIEL